MRQLPWLAVSACAGWQDRRSKHKTHPLPDSPLSVSVIPFSGTLFEMEHNGQAPDGARRTPTC